MTSAFPSICPLLNSASRIRRGMAQELAQPVVRNTFSGRTRVAKLADAPDLGFRNQRFQSIALRFKKESF